MLKKIDKISQSLQNKMIAVKISQILEKKQKTLCFFGKSPNFTVIPLFTKNERHFVIF